MRTTKNKSPNRVIEEVFASLVLYSYLLIDAKSSK